MSALTRDFGFCQPPKKSDMFWPILCITRVFSVCRHWHPLCKCACIFMKWQGSQIALVCSYLRVPKAAGQVKILIFLFKIKYFPIYGNNFCDAGQVLILRYFEARNDFIVWLCVREWTTSELHFFVKMTRGRCFFCWSFMFFLSFVCHAFVHVCLYVPCGHLLGKGWPLASRLWCLTVSLSLSHRYCGSGVVLHCIDSWSLHPK